MAFSTFTTAQSTVKKSSPIRIDFGREINHEAPSVCHDLRGSANGIQGHLEFAMDEMEALFNHIHDEKLQSAYKDLEQFNLEVVCPLIETLTTQLDTHKSTFESTPLFPAGMNSEEKSFSVPVQPTFQVELGKVVDTQLKKVPGRLYSARRHLKEIGLLETISSDPAKLAKVSEIKTYLRGISLCHRQLTRLLNVSAVKEEVFGLKKAVEDALLMINGKAKKKNIQFVSVLPEGEEAFVKMNVLGFTRVLDNLLSNAVKFTPAGGHVTVGVAVEANDRNSTTITVKVTDTGIGMNPIALMNLFKPYHRGDSPLVSETKGTGLGLYNSRNLAKKLNGDIQATSQETQGSTFTFTSEGEVPTPAEIMAFETRNKAVVTPPLSPIAPLPDAYGDLTGVKILIVDDQKINQQILQKMLLKARATCELASSGQEAIVKNATFRPNVIFMDIQMPEMDGLEASRSIRSSEVGSSMPVRIIGASGNASLQDRKIALAAGMNDYVTKPYILSKVLHSIELDQPLPHSPTSPLKLGVPAILSSHDLILPCSTQITGKSVLGGAGFFSKSMQSSLPSVNNSSVNEVRRRSYESQRATGGFFERTSAVERHMDNLQKMTRCASTPAISVRG